MTQPIDPKIQILAEKVIAQGANKRAIAVLKVLLDKGSISTDDIQALGYNHPPRAIGDVRDAGIPIITGSSTSTTGKRMAVYMFGQPADIQEGRVGGRSAFPKAFKQALLKAYGSQDRITGATLDERVLTIDHRVPYRIAGDAGLSDHDVKAYMLLDASSQRAKSWSCENCPNMAPSQRKAAVCATCYWAFPEVYEHIATQHVRRTDIAWQGEDVAVYEAVKEKAAARRMSVGDLLKVAARQIAKSS